MVDYNYNTFEIADVTRRLSSGDVALVNVTSVKLLAGIDKHKKVNLFFQVYCPGLSGPYKTYEVDTVLERSDLPDPAGNQQQWKMVGEKVRENSQLSLDEAWLLVAMKNAIRKWKFSIEEEADDIFSLSIKVPRRSDSLDARVDDKRLFKIVS